MLVINHLTKTFGDKLAVDDLSLQIAPGEICAFIGHNGAGKTTTIKACCGILQPDSGEIFIAGKSVANDPIACKKELAYSPDNPDLYEFLSGIQYLNFVADIFGVSMEDLVNYEKTDRENMGLEVPPKGKHVFGMVKVGDKGQIVIPANARKIFDIQPGDNLLILGDEEQGIAILKEKKFLEQLRLMERMRHMGSGE